MKAIRVHQFGPPSNLLLEEVETPTPKSGEVLIHVHAAGVNYPDLLLVAGKYQVKPALPFTPGLEVSGVISSVGPGVVGLHAGQRVLAQVDMGGFAEFVAAPAGAVQLIPDELNDVEASAFSLVYQTSYFGLVTRGQLRKGETVLVHSAAGGVGLAALQLARALGAGKIIGTTGSDSKLDFIRQQGADLAINYEKTDFADAVKEFTGGHGANLIFDPVGGQVAERSTKCIAFEGRLVLVGFTSGQFSNFTSNHVLLKNYSVIGLHWGVYRRENPALILQTWAELFSLIRAGKIKPIVSASFPMTKVVDAMEFLARREAVGKVVLAVHERTPVFFPEANSATKPAQAVAPEASRAANVLGQLIKKIGKETGVSDWFEMDQSRINQFADATLDYQFIHVDPVQCLKSSPYKKTIAHGFLSLSLIPHFLGQVVKKNPLFSEDPKVALNYGLDRVRFPAPVVVGSKLRGRVELLSAELKAPDTIQIKQKVTLEVEGETKPVCVAEMLARFVF